MSLRARLWLIIVGLFGIASVEYGLRLHLRKIGPVTHREPARPLAEVPLSLGAAATPQTRGLRWEGAEHPQVEQLRSILPYVADDLLYRRYQAGPNGPMVELYMVYSKSGDDRKHHPEICIRDVAGAPEDASARRQIALGGDGQRNVQRFRFRVGNAAPITVYYWHYTFPALADQNRNWLQDLHLQLRQPAPSLTVQVTSRGDANAQDLVERTFLGALDAALQTGHLAPDVRIGCDRLPIGLNRQ